MMMLFLIVTFCLVIQFCHSTVSHEEMLKILDNAKTVTESAIKAIYDEWEVDKYPNFLKSCSMHKSGYELMKMKLMSRILSSNEVPGHKGTFVASFLGSSVTAGHDSHFNKSTPVVVGELMKSSFDALNINFESRNAALGNNPCVPYDVCTPVFAGMDADIVHWEQSYFCFGGSIFEQFVRQSMLIPSRPIVIFSESNTGHWEEKQCRLEAHKVTDQEKELLSKPMETIVSELNKDEAQRAFGHISQWEKKYPGAGIQKFTHEKHKDYACLGPYIPKWMLGAASWHPSVIAHRLRASHHSYFWLVILKEAIEELSKTLNANKERPTDALLKDIELRLSHIYKPMPGPHHYSQWQDGMKCYTDYEPQYSEGNSLKQRVVSGLLSDNADEGTGWKAVIYEDLVDKELVKRSKARMYKDYKHLIYGGKDAGPLVLKVNVEKSGPIFLCQTPGIWGSLPKGFKDIWSENPSITIHSTTYPEVPLSLFHNKELDICAMLVKPVSNGTMAVKTTYPHKALSTFDAGEHTITIKVIGSEKIIIAWLITS
jgi:hypothetical protein